MPRPKGGGGVGIAFLLLSVSGTLRLSASYYLSRVHLRRAGKKCGDGIYLALKHTTGAYSDGFKAILQALCKSQLFLKYRLLW